MEDKNLHIDSFLENKFEGFEPKVNSKAWEAILHGMHPIDLSLSVHLNENQTIPSSESKQAIFSAVENSSHPIDSSLYKNLSNIEKPTQTKFADIQISRNKRRYRTLWLLAILFMTTASGLLLYNHYESNYQKETNQTAHIDSDVKPTNRNKDLNTLKNQRLNSASSDISSTKKQADKVQEMQQSLSSINKASTNNSTKRINRLENIIPDQAQPISSEIAEATLPRFMYLKGIPYLENETLELRDELAVKTEQKEKSTRFKISPIGIGMSIGYLSENNRNTSLTNENLHKDALSNFNNSSASTKSGINISVLLDYNIRNRIQINTGVQYSYSHSTSKFDYVYSQIPVYDTTGRLLGYFQRPASQSPQFNEQIKSSSRLISIPIQALYRINSGYKYSIHLGAGIDWTLKNSMQTKLFNFETESIEDKSSSQNNGIQAKLILQLKYKIRANWNLHFNMISAYRNQHLNVDNTRYDWGVLSPSFNLGFTYNPIFKLK